MTVRKNFNFDETVAKHLEEIAKYEGKTMTDAVQEAIEEKFRQIAAKRRKEALESMIGVADGAIGQKTIQQMKAESEL